MSDADESAPDTNGSTLHHTGIPQQKDGRDIVSVGAYRVLWTFDSACTGEFEPLRDDIRTKMGRVLEAFPELAGKTVTVGRLNPDEDAVGRARFYNYMVLFPVDRVTSWQTVYHELAHLAIHARREDGQDVPTTSEEYCSILAVSRMPVDRLDEDRIAYLGHPQVTKAEWPDICQRALEYREDHHDYIKQCKAWLEVDDE